MISLMHLSAVEKKFSSGSETLTIFDGLTLDIFKGDFVAIMGPSGSGKTTLLNMLGGVDQPTGGEIIFDAKRIDKMGENALASWRAANVGFIFQSYNLMASLTAARNVELPLLLTSLSGAERKERVQAALDLVGLADRSRHKPSQLSGGQQQRVAIARSIIADPQLILADEPTGDLDRKTANEILDILTQLNQNFGKTIVMVTHDPEAARYAQRIWHLDKGNFTEETASSQPGSLSGSLSGSQPGPEAGHKTPEIKG